MTDLETTEIMRIIALLILISGAGLLFIDRFQTILTDIATIFFCCSNAIYIIATRTELETICKVTAFLTELSEKELTAMLKKKQEENKK